MRFLLRFVAIIRMRKFTQIQQMHTVFAVIIPCTLCMPHTCTVYARALHTHHKHVRTRTASTCIRNPPTPVLTEPPPLQRTPPYKPNPQT